ncbi:MAG: hypothetical protein ACYC4L_06765 [Chloroflexota bacterium]
MLNRDVADRPVNRRVDGQVAELALTVALLGTVLSTASVTVGDRLSAAVVSVFAQLLKF